MTGNETYVAAGYVAGYHWKPPTQDWTKHLPAAVITVSDCLTDFLPAGQDPVTAPWHPSLQDAINAAARTSPLKPETAHVLAMSVPTSAANALATMIDNWIGDYPHPIHLSLAHRSPAPVGKIQGFEVLGFEAGRFHSWLCYSLRGQAAAELSVSINDRGLLDTLADARRVADMANIGRGTPDGTPEEVTWFPALITEYEPAQSDAGSLELKDPATLPDANRPLGSR